MIALIKHSIKRSKGRVKYFSSNDYSKIESINLDSLFEDLRHPNPNINKQAYMKMALEWAKLSYCKRKQVGALIVKENMIISDGYNGTPSGFENNCELESGETKWYVLHAEANAILKCAKYGQSCQDADLYLTLS